MPITLTDDITETGTINVNQDGDVVRISGSHAGIDVLAGDPVVVRAEAFYFRIKIEWNGGAADATVLEISTPEVLTNVVVYQQTASPVCEWVIEYDNTNSTTRDELELRATPGNDLQQISYTGFAYGISRTAIGFITKNADGDPINPADGDICWIQVGPSV